MPLSMLINPRPEDTDFGAHRIIAPNFRYRISKRLLPIRLTQILRSCRQRQLFIETFANHLRIDTARPHAAQTVIGCANNDAHPFRNGCRERLISVLTRTKTGLLPQDHA